jgi:hypothetical protein
MRSKRGRGRGRGREERETYLYLHYWQKTGSQSDGSYYCWYYDGGDGHGGNGDAS